MITGSKVVDAQAAYESNLTMFSVLLAGANYVFHAAGWSEAGLTASFSKFALDAEQMAMFYKLAKRVSFDDFEEAMAAVREVGPGGHYLGTAHTQEHFQTAFFMPDLLDNNNYEQWLADGASDSNTRGLAAAKAMLERYEEPTLDPGIDEALREFIAKREHELPDEMR
jgi:trimethylamine--corrinoid protein Co-methyltransferase